MIDLRSDTLTMPDLPMLQTILVAPMGDDGRQNSEGRGEDATVNLLEDISAELVGKEASVFCDSGTMGNLAALLTYCKPGDIAMVDELQHLYRSEKTAFDANFGRVQPLFYRYDEHCMPDVDDMRAKMAANKVALLCLENTHNSLGGTCTDIEHLRKIRALADDFDLRIHLDGARLFNAASYLGVTAKEICAYADSVMFCVSKGLGAPVGSLLCGTKEFVKKARETRKLLGGNMRQAGVIAAPAIYALQHNVERLREDNENAQYAASLLTDLKKAKPQANVQTNIMMLDVRETGISAGEYCNRAKELGLWIRPALPGHVRLVFYKGITKEDACNAAQIIKKLDVML